MALKMLFDNFELLADAPNGVQKLREMILQLAVRGKLVSQNPEDEPASVLLEKIRAEKERLIKAKVIKKTKALTPIQDNEVPYILPEGWVFVILNEIVLLKSGSTIDCNIGNPVKNNNIYQIPYVKVGDMNLNGNEKFITISSHYVEVTEKLQRFVIPRNSIIFPKRGGAIATNKKRLVKNEIFADSNIMSIVCIPPLNIYYLYCWLSQIDLWKLNSGTSVPQINNKDIGPLLFALPPLQEQKRIVTKVDQLMALCDELETRKQKTHKTGIRLNQASVNNLLTASQPAQFNQHWRRIRDNFDLLYNQPENVAQLRQAILQLAVQGKLVPQDPNDEPASVLLQKIQAEKERLIKAKKIKKTKPLPAIDDDDAPYALPEGWVWTTLSDIGVINPRNQINDETEVSFVPMKLVPTELGGQVKSECRKWGEIRKGFTHFADGDVALAKITPCFQNRKSVVMRNLVNGVGAGTTELLIFRALIKQIIPEYVLIHLKSPIFINEGLNKMTGTAGQKRVPKLYFAETPFPLPPFDAQKRIVAKVDQLMALCDELESGLTQSQTDCERLVEAVVGKLMVA